MPRWALRLLSVAAIVFGVFLALAFAQQVPDVTDNAMGFHNRQKSLDTLARAIDLAGRARLAVKDALLP